MSNLSRRKAVLFSLLPVTVLVLILALVEGMLRMTQKEAEVPLVLEMRYDGVTWLGANRSYLGKYFPPGSPSIPEFKTTLFRREKSPRSFRIMCLGGSTMFGTPYDMNANIAGIVRKQLRRLLPDREVEVINWGATAIGSNVIRDFAPRLLAFQPDLVLIYMGHNEFYGPGGVGASWVEKNVPWLSRLGAWVRDLRLVRMVLSWLPQRPPVGNEEATNLMKQVSGGSLVALESQDAERIFRLFGENLRAIVGTLQEARVPVILSDVSSNQMFPPFVSDSLEQGGNLIAEAKGAVLRGDPARALAIRHTLSGHDTANAFVNYWAGRAALLQGDSLLARELLRCARDNDLLKFRAPSRINAIIHEVAAERGVPLLAADSLFSALSPGGVPGDSLFWEHLHPRLAGYYALASGFVRSMVEERLVLDPAAGRPLIPLNADSLSIAWLELAYADVSIQNLTGHWPFEEYVRRPEVLPGADPALLRIVMDTYRRAIAWNEGCYRSATFFWSRSDLRRAETTYEALIEDYPSGFYANYLLGSLLTRMGKAEAALGYYLRSIASNPDYPQSRVDCGLLQVNRGKFDEAIMQFQTALRLLVKPEQRGLRSDALYGLGAAFANKGEMRQALEMLDRSLEASPSNRSAAQLRSQISGRR
jgi:tetratricopeptide (TPR) repeat protein